MSFLPKDYKAPAGSSDFFKFQDGENRFRIMSSEAIVGWEGWKDNKPFRRKGIEKNIKDSEVDLDTKFSKSGKPKINHFWAFIVWDYADKKLKILEITQKTVMKTLEGLVSDPDWGAPTAYDLSVNKSLVSGRTVYSVKAYPPKEMPKEIKDEYKKTELNIETLFEASDIDPDKEFEGL